MKRTLSSESSNITYTEHDHRTWQDFFTQIESVWGEFGDLIHPYYKDNADVLYLFRDKVPTLAEINEVLEKIGWSAAYVDGYAPGWSVAAMLGQHIMPISRKIRPPEEIHFANEPDLIHDIFGHLPSLLSPSYRKLLKQWSDIVQSFGISEADKTNYHLNKLIVTSEGVASVKTVDCLKRASLELTSFLSERPTPSYLYDKLYFWIFEFGLLQNADGMKILGAGILSSMTEVRKLAREKVVTYKLLDSPLISPVNISSMQNSYLVVEDIGDFATAINQTKMIEVTSYAKA